MFIVFWEGKAIQMIIQKQYLNNGVGYKDIIDNHINAKKGGDHAKKEDIFFDFLSKQGNKNQAINQISKNVTYKWKMYVWIRWAYENWIKVLNNWYSVIEENLK